MKASEHNIETLMMSLHKKIEEYSDFLSTQIKNGDPIQHVTYPPNNGFTEKEIESLKKLTSDEDLQTALRKLIADSMAGVFFDFFNYIDGTGDPEEEVGKWTELSLVDKNDSIEPPIEMLHDKFFETYWHWRKIRPKKGWKLDTYEQ